MFAKLRTVFSFQPFHRNAGTIYVEEHSHHLILFNHGRHHCCEAPCASSVPRPASDALWLCVPSIIPTVTHCFVKKQAQWTETCFKGLQVIGDAIRFQVCWPQILLFLLDRSASLARWLQHHQRTQLSCALHNPNKVWNYLLSSQPSNFFQTQSFLSSPFHPPGV